MPDRRRKVEPRPHGFANLKRLEALGDAIFAFALILLCLALYYRRRTASLAAP